MQKVLFVTYLLAAFREGHIALAFEDHTTSSGLWLAAGCSYCGRGHLFTKR